MRFKNLAAALVIGASAVMPARAAVVTLNGTDVSFTFDDATLFGPGTVVGNSLFFTPTNFRAESADGAGADTASETLIITVEATTANYVIDMLAMVEQGDYILDQNGGTDAQVTASGYLGVTSNTTTCGIFACSDSSIFNVPGLTDTGGATQGWSDGTSVDLGAVAGWGSDTKLTVSFQNNLGATTLNLGEYAMIQKKSGAIGLVVNPIPVPAAVWLFGSGVLGLVAVARRRKSA